MDHKLLFLYGIAERDEPSAPHTPLGHSEAFVVGPLLRHFPFELGEFQHDVKKEPSRRRGRVEMLGSGNEFDVMLIENFEKGVEILVIAGEAVDLVDHYGLDTLLLDILDELL
ncbi:MAG: hypothetical protein WC530_02125 [Candidatus Omnitrophota bacterium]